MNLQITLLVWVLAACLICNVLSVTNEDENEIQSYGTSNRVPKLLMSVSVPPTPCGTNNEGVCLPKRACGKRGGQVAATGTCRNGFGECCLFTAMCNATTSDVELTQHVTTITSPTPITTSCSFRIKKQTNVCQVLLRFVTYTSANADSNGACSTDSFSVRGSVTVDEGFTTCGTLTDQHMYLSFGNADTIQIRPTFTQAGGGSYNIIVTQIPCNSNMRVPDYCLQNFRETSGRVTSFGYPIQQQNSQMYTVCVGGNTNPTRISWKRCEQMNSPQNTFLIAGGSPQGSGGCEEDSDWVQINGRNRRCEFPPAPSIIQSRVAPFTLNVNFNDHEHVDIPIPEDLRNLNERDCGNVAAARPDLVGVVSCLWQGPVPPAVDGGVCVCTFSASFVAFFGVSDFMNTGFCLEYTQT